MASLDELLSQLRNLNFKPRCETKSCRSRALCSSCANMLYIDGILHSVEQHQSQCVVLPDEIEAKAQLLVQKYGFTVPDLDHLTEHDQEPYDPAKDPNLAGAIAGARIDMGTDMGTDVEAKSWQPEDDSESLRLKLNMALGTIQFLRNRYGPSAGPLLNNDLDAILKACRPSPRGMADNRD